MGFNADTALEKVSLTGRPLAKMTAGKNVFRIQSDADRRSTHLHLSEKGKLINEMHSYAHRRMVEDIQKKISPDEMVSLINLLEKLLV